MQTFPCTQVAQLRKYLAGKDGHHYVDMKTMIEYEKKKDMIYRKSPQSGTELALMLHRGLGGW